MRRAALVPWCLLPGASYACTRTFGKLFPCIYCVSYLVSLSCQAQRKNRGPLKSPPLSKEGAPVRTLGREIEPLQPSAGQFKFVPLIRSSRQTETLRRRAVFHNRLHRRIKDKSPFSARRLLLQKRAFPRRGFLLQKKAFSRAICRGSLIAGEPNGEIYTQGKSFPNVRVQAYGGGGKGQASCRVRAVFELAAPCALHIS